MTRRLAEGRRFATLIVVGVLAGFVVSSGAGIALAGLNPFTDLVRSALRSPAVLEFRWLQVPVVRPSPQNWTNLARQVVEDYLGTEPPVSPIDGALFVELPDWYGPIPADVPGRYRFVTASELLDVATRDGEVEYVEVRWCYQQQLRTVMFDVAVDMQFRPHPKIFRVHRERHGRRFACRPSFSRWICEHVAEKA